VDLKQGKLYKGEPEQGVKVDTTLTVDDQDLVDIVSIWTPLFTDVESYGIALKRKKTGKYFGPKTWRNFCFTPGKVIFINLGQLLFDLLLAV